MTLYRTLRKQLRPVKRLWVERLGQRYWWQTHGLPWHRPLACRLGYHVWKTAATKPWWPHYRLSLARRVCARCPVQEDVLIQEPREGAGRA